MGRLWMEGRFLGIVSGSAKSASVHHPAALGEGLRGLLPTRRLPKT